MGRPRKPTSLHVLQGTYRDDRHGGGVRAETGVPEPPEGLSEAALAEWERITPELAALGLLTRMDRAALSAYCQVWARWVQAEREMAAKGPVYLTTEGNLVQNPWLWVANKTLDQLRHYAGLFGLTPSSRASLNPPAPPEPEDPMNRLLSGRPPVS